MGEILIKISDKIIQNLPNMYSKSLITLSTGNDSENKIIMPCLQKFGQTIFNISELLKDNDIMLKEQSDKIEKIEKNLLKMQSKTDCELFFNNFESRIKEYVS